MHKTFRKELKERKLLLGTMVTLPTASTAEILAGLGFDWLFVDGEHGPLEAAEMLSILQTVGDKAACLVRSFFWHDSVVSHRASVVSPLQEGEGAMGPPWLYDCTRDRRAT